MLAFFRRQNGRAFFPPLPIAALLRRSWRWADSNGGAWNVSALHSRFCKAKGQRHFKTMLAFGASRRPYRPTTVCTGQLAGNRTRPASRGTRRATAVKPRPSCMSLYAPARLRRAVRGAGGHPLPRAARPVAERRPWGRKRREREAIRRTFPKRHTYLYSPARPRRAVRG